MNIKNIIYPEFKYGDIGEILQKRRSLFIENLEDLYEKARSARNHMWDFDYGSVGPIFLFFLSISFGISICTFFYCIFGEASKASVITTIIGFSIFIFLIICGLIYRLQYKKACKIYHNLDDELNNQIEKIMGLKCKVDYYSLNNFLEFSSTKILLASDDLNEEKYRKDLQLLTNLQNRTNEGAIIKIKEIVIKDNNAFIILEEYVKDLLIDTHDIFLCKYENESQRNQKIASIYDNGCVDFTFLDNYYKKIIAGIPS